MKLSFRLGLITACLIISSCSSPEKDGKERGLKLCNCIGETNTASVSYLLQAKRDSCIKISMSDLDKEYNTDAAKYQRFKDSFENTTQKTAYDFNLALSTMIKAELSDKVWVKENETNYDHYLCLFKKGVFSYLNCKGGYDFELNGDTIVFEDDKKTSGTVKFTSEKILQLSIPEQGSTSTYRLAESKDLLIGRWDVWGQLIFNFSPSGTCVMSGLGFLTKTATYMLDSKSTLSVGVSASYKPETNHNADSFQLVMLYGAGSYKMKMNNNDSFSWDGGIVSRIKSRRSDNLIF